jgi:hypothetical protein
MELDLKGKILKNTTKKFLKFYKTHKKEFSFEGAY